MCRRRNLRLLSGAPVLAALLLGPLAAQSPTWTGVATAAGPQNFGPTSITTDSQRGRVVLLGSTQGDLREWDGSRFEVRATSTPAVMLTAGVIAYDSLRGRTIGVLDQFSFTFWFWDGINLAAGTAAHVPPVRSGAAIAYDSARDRIVYFGGTGALPRNDLWEYDGLDWVDRTPANRPSPRFGMAMSFDSARGRTVMFGGTPGNGPTYFGDTWEWDGSAWLQRNPALQPSARAGHGLAFDPVRARTVLCAGTSAAGAEGDTWEWDGTDWAQIGTAVLPTNPLHAGVQSVCAYDHPRQQTVLVRHKQTWVYRNAVWTRAPLAVTGGPEAIAYDPIRDRALMFVENTAAAETWEWDGARWSLLQPIHSPPFTSNQEMVFDEHRRRTVMFGGQGLYATFYSDQTWEWDGADWRFAPTTTAPPPRQWHSMAYDGARRVVVLFGGYGTQWPSRLGDTWEWDGTAWTARAVAGPVARSNAAMAFDPVRQVTVLFGGFGSSGLDDTWHWDGSAWTQQQPTSRPPARWYHTMTWDSWRQRVLVYGGGSSSVALRDTWEWDGSTWTQLATGVGPPTYPSGKLAHDSRRGRNLYHDGSNTWALGVVGAAVASPYGSGCGSPALALVPQSRPILGQSQVLDVTPASNGLAFAMLGWSSATAGGLPLPLSLAFLGMPGCELLQSLDTAVPCATTGPASARVVLAVPNAPFLAGLFLFVQAWSPATGANPAGVIVSNGVSLLVGGS